MDIFSGLENSIKELKQISNSSFNKEKISEINQKESFLLLKIVNYIDDILKDNLINNFIDKNQYIENKTNYWKYILNHFNTQLVNYCETYENEDSNEKSDKFLVQKGKKWIYFSILEKTLNDSINQIYKQGLDKIYYKNDSLLRKYKTQIFKNIKELEEIELINIMNKEYKKYLQFLKSQNNVNKNPFIIKKLSANSIFSTMEELNPPQDNKKLKLFSKVSKINFNYNYKHMDSEDKKLCKLFLDKNTKNYGNDNNYHLIKISDFSKSIIENFYTFQEKKDEEEIILIHSGTIKEDLLNESNSNSNRSIKNEEIEKNQKSGLILNPEKSMHLPIDNLYEQKYINYFKQSSKDSKFALYEKLENENTNNIISNTSLLYLNYYYKKDCFYKFFKYNLYNKPLSLKMQNYQCFICYKRFDILLGVPIEQVYWCSYYLRFVCKNCIDDEYSIIPQLILKKGCFDKFPISKKARDNLLIWYNKPVIYFLKKDILLNNIPNLNNILVIKEIINNMVDYMKCKDNLNYIQDIFEEYDYLALKEYLFSLRDLIQIKNKSFFKKMNDFKNKLFRHITEECPDCKYEGEYCIQCSSKEKIFLYNVDKVYYCYICKKSFHKKCIEFTGHNHPKSEN